MGVTSDPADPRLAHYTGPEEPAPQAEVYLVLSAEQRAMGFVRPVRHSYTHHACGGSTRMGSCRAHFPVREFTWDEDGAVVGS